MKDLVDVEKFKEYLMFVEKAGKEYSEEEYGEIHHIYPKCIDVLGEHLTETVKISAKNHYIAHLMLVECFCGEGKRKLSYAVNMFRRGKHKEYLSEEDIQIARNLFSESRKVKHSRETVAKMSKLKKELMQSQEAREKISKTLKNKWKCDEEFARRELEILKKPRSESARRNISEGSKKRSQRKDYQNKMSLIYASEEYRKNISKAKTGKKLFTNGIEKHFYFLGEEPSGYYICRM